MSETAGKDPHAGMGMPPDAAPPGGKPAEEEDAPPAEGGAPAEGQDPPQDYDASGDFLAQVLRADSPAERALLRMNGGLVNDAIQTGRRLPALLEAKEKTSERIEWLFLATVSRPPTDEELGHYLRFIDGADDEEEAYQDVLWTLINTTEFGVNR
jgi:hypothetical protein